MTLFYGVLLACVSAIFFSIVLLGSRNPKSPKWAGEFLVGSFYIPMIMGLAVCSVFFLFKAFLTDSLDAKALLSSGITLGICVLILWQMKIGQKIKKFALEESTPSSSSGAVLEFTSPTPEPETPNQSSPPRLAA